MWKLSAVLVAALAAACGGSSEPDNVSMVRSLESLQCTGGGTTPAALQAQLVAAGIQVIAASCGFDGLPHPAVCGAPDGALAIFDLPAAQQVVAQTLGFILLSSMPSAVRATCS